MEKIPHSDQIKLKKNSIFKLREVMKMFLKVLEKWFLLKFEAGI